MPKYKELLSGIWMTYTNESSGVWQIPTSLNVYQRLSKDIDPKEAKETTQNNHKHQAKPKKKNFPGLAILIEPSESSFPHTAPSLDQYEVLSALDAFENYVKSRAKEGKRIVLTWSDLEGLKIKTWIVTLEEEADPYECDLDTYGQLSDALARHVIATLPKGWKKKDISAKLAAIKADIETSGLYLGFTKTQGILVSIICKDGSLSALADRI